MKRYCSLPTATHCLYCPDLCLHTPYSALCLLMFCVYRTVSSNPLCFVQLSIAAVCKRLYCCTALQHAMLLLHRTLDVLPVQQRNCTMLDRGRWGQTLLPTNVIPSKQSTVASLDDKVRKKRLFDKNSRLGRVFFPEKGAKTNGFKY